MREETRKENKVSERDYIFSTKEKQNLSGDDTWLIHNSVADAVLTTVGEAEDIRQIKNICL